MEVGVGKDAALERSSDVAHRTQRMIGYLLSGGGTRLLPDPRFIRMPLGSGIEPLQEKLIGNALPRWLNHVHPSRQLSHAGLSIARHRQSQHDGSGVRNLLRCRSLYSYLHDPHRIALPLLAIRPSPPLL